MGKQIARKRTSLKWLVMCRDGYWALLSHSHCNEQHVSVECRHTMRPSPYLSSWKFTHWLLLPWGIFTPILHYLHFFVFEFEARTGRTDRQTDGRAIPVMRPTRTAAYSDEGMRATVILSYSGGLSLMIPWGKAPVTGYTRLTRLFHNLRDRCAPILNVRLDAKHDDEWQ